MPHSSTSCLRPSVTVGRSAGGNLASLAGAASCDALAVAMHRQPGLSRQRASAVNLRGGLVRDGAKMRDGGLVFAEQQPHDLRVDFVGTRRGTLVKGGRKPADPLD